MNIREAQNDMRESYLGGATGALVSGIIWLIAGSSTFFVNELTSISILFFGGMLIFPASTILSKILKRRGKHLKENPLASLAMESTLIIFIGLFIAYAIFQNNSSWFFPIMLIIIGVRYVIFQSIYGMKLYWIFGLTLILAGMFCMMSNQAFYMAPLVGGGIEIVFALIIFKLESGARSE